MSGPRRWNGLAVDRLRRGRPDSSQLSRWLRERRHPLRGTSQIRRSFPDKTTSAKASIVATYQYLNQGGLHLYDVCRLEPKDFRQRSADGTWKTAGIPRVLYRLPELQGQTIAYLPEGERDVEGLRGLGLTATCNAGGAGKWRPEYTQQLKAAAVEHVVILPDNDDPGRAHADMIAASCHAAGLKVKVVTLPDLPLKGDVSDWLDAGHTKDELIALVKATPLYVPTAASAKYAKATDSEPVPAGNATAFARPAVTSGLGEPILAALPARPYSGWCKRGAVHLIAGSSGAGKTTLMLDCLRMQARGASYLGHVGARLPYLVLFADRGAVSNTETLARMRIDPITMPIDHLPPTTNGAAALKAILAAIERQPDLPAALFIEGADLLVEDASKPHVVIPFVTALRTIAEHYALSIVLSVGSAKARPQEQYALKRDQVYGTQAWGRLADTILVVSTTGDGTAAARDVSVLHRNDAAETFHLTFADGLLVETAASQATEPDMVVWFREQEIFTQQRFRNVFSLSGARATTLLDSYVGIGTLREKVKGDRTHYVYRRPPTPSSPTDGVRIRTETDTLRASKTTAESVPDTARTDTANDPTLHEILNDLGSNGSLSLTPPKSVRSVRSDSLQHHDSDNGHGLRGSRPEARWTGHVPADDAPPFGISPKPGPVAANRGSVQ